jgi:hypothetical protein
MWIAMGLGASAPRAWLVAAMTATCPLFWITALRPLSDVPGLFFAMMSQGLALAAYAQSVARAGDSADPAERRSSLRWNYWLLGAALLAGVAVGIRVQTAWLTMPLLTVVTWLCTRQGGPWAIAQVLAAVMVGLLIWGVPMMSMLGGPAEYFRLLTTVVADDVEGVEMLATHPSPRLLALALRRTFVVPWGSPVLGWSLFGLSVVGALVLMRCNRRLLGFAAVMGLPYLAFHLLFQESASIRYALPLVPVSCLLIANLPLRPTRLTMIAAAALLVSASTLSIRAATEYGRAESPVARAFEDVRREATSRPEALTLAFHHAVGRALRGEAWDGRVLPAPVRYEWLELASYWLDGKRDPVWFLADARRTDLALVDPASRKLIRSYRWPAGAESLLGGIQPPGVSWHEVVSPGWFLMRGWALTPEAHGLARRDGRAPGTTGIVGHVRRRAEAAIMMIGGRNLGGPCDTAAMVEVGLDGRSRATWRASAQASFLQVIALAPGELRGEGEYATITVAARDTADTGRIVDVAIEHFDVQSPGSALAGFDRGWHMPELEPSNGRSWRWTDEAAELRVEGFGRDVDIVVRGESPLRYFQRPPRVVVRTGRTELGVYHPDADFEWVVTVPAGALAAGDGRVTLETDQWFVPDEVSGNGDRRRLGLRIYSVETRLRLKTPEAGVAR